ncbi:E3 ubiquitin-protein ligase TRIM7-like [Leucoraja erinacea]|uniref:E3 ubiquitin-protein ligase TRIM7-like n=1 Tax=Leucoraja erinaceus TaxID=7782 RepID=UPI002454F23B|nr:E3 ubiquitin-protein ligase TRIM7-like [Leucoraja erinacea]
MDTPVPASDCAVCRSPGLAASARRLPCGHRLCSDCARYSDTALGGSLDCPTCSGPVTAPLPALDVATVAAGGRAERLCPQHGQPLQLFCQQDGQCVCTSCMDSGAHREHTVTSLDTARDSLKAKLLTRVKTLFQTQQNCHFKYQDLKKTENDIKTQMGRLKGNLAKKFSEWRESLREGEEEVLSMVDEEGQRLLAHSSRSSHMLDRTMDLIQQIDEQSQRLTQEDPLDFIQAVKELLSKASEVQKQKIPTHHKDTLNMNLISDYTKERVQNSMLYHSAITSIVGEWARLTLDPKTAYWFLTVSEDARSLSFGYDLQPYPSNPERFRTHRQILCCQSFSSGYHTWVVEAEGIAWGIGVAYGSIAREGLTSDLANSDKAWCVHFSHGTLTASHSGAHTDIISDPTYNRFQVELDFDMGTVSFYQVNHSLKHLHTFKTTFSEPIFPAFSCFYISSLKLC